MFDTSDYPVDNIAGLPIMNKKELGLFKDECKFKQMIEFVGLRPKLYAPKVQDNAKAEKKCKGVKKSIVEKCITFHDYKKCLFEGKVVYTKFNMLRSRNHVVTTDRVTKVALSAKDDKRYIIPNDLEHKTFAIGHWRVK